MKKIIFILSSLLAVIILLGILFLARNSEKKEAVQTVKGNTETTRNYSDEIPVRSWDNVAGDYIICKTELEGEINRSFTDTGSVTYFSSQLSLDEMVQTNIEDFIGNVAYPYLRFRYDGRLFYHDNNYYVLYYNDKSKEYIGRNCFSVYTYGSDWVNVPMPMTICFDRDVFEVCEEMGSPLLDVLFNQYSFEELCEFYQRMNADVYELDVKNKSITIDGYCEGEKKYMDKFLIINFEEQCVSAKNAEGKVETWR